MSGNRLNRLTARASEVGHWRELVAISALSCVGFSGVLFLPVLVGALATSYNVGDAEAGRIAFAQLASISLASLSLAPRMDRTNRRMVATVGIGLIIGGNIMPVIGNSLANLYLAQILYGLGQGLVLTALHACYAGMRQPDRAVALANLVLLSLGVLCYPSIGSAIAHFGIEALFVSIAGWTILTGWTAKWLPVGGRAQVRGDVAASQRSLILPTHVAALVGIGLFYVGEGALWGYVGRIGLAAGQSMEAISRILSLAFVFSLLGPIGAQLVGDRFGRLLPILISILGLIAVALALGFSQDARVFEYVCYFFYAIFSLAVIYSTGLAAAIDPSGRLAASVPGFRMMGTAIGPLIASFAIMDGDYRGLGVVAALFYAASMAAFILASHGPWRQTCAHD